MRTMLSDNDEVFKKVQYLEKTLATVDKVLNDEIYILTKRVNDLENRLATHLTDYNVHTTPSDAPPEPPPPRVSADLLHCENERCPMSHIVLHPMHSENKPGRYHMGSYHYQGDKAAW